jgi:rifampin ADP-ribosylating transferase
MTNRYYHGTRTELTLRDLIAPTVTSAADDRDPARAHVFLTTNLDEAIWSAELATGDAPARVYVVEPLGPIARVSQQPGYEPPGHPSMSWCSREPLRVTGEVTEWLHYHGTRADLQTGDLIRPGHISNFGATARTANHIYFTRTLDAATWGAELAVGEGRGRIYIVEPTGPIEDDPNLTNKRFRGNPTKSFRSREPLRVTGEITDWQGHAPEAIQAMKAGLERRKQLGVEAIDD